MYKHMLKNYTIQETTAAVSHSIYIIYWWGVGWGSRDSSGGGVYKHMLKNYTIQETTAVVSHSIYIRYWRGVGWGSRQEWGRSV